jgi:peptide deformylase
VGMEKGGGGSRGGGRERAHKPGTIRWSGLVSGGASLARKLCNPTRSGGESPLSRQAIRLFGDPVLRTPAAKVTDFDRSLGRLVDDLVETMLDADGAGLAAPQIGVGLRVFSFYVPGAEDDNGGHVAHLVNPEIVEQSIDEVEDEEGCLSVPGFSYFLRRSQRVVARGFDRNGEPLEVVGTERLARALLHETDHLDGVLFLDRLDPEIRRKAMREVREAILAGENIVVRDSPHAPLR